MGQVNGRLEGQSGQPHPNQLSLPSSHSPQLRSSTFSYRVLLSTNASHADEHHAPSRSRSDRSGAHTYSDKYASASHASRNYTATERGGTSSSAMATLHQAYSGAVRSNDRISSSNSRSSPTCANPAAQPCKDSRRCDAARSHKVDADAVRMGSAPPIPYFQHSAKVNQAGAIGIAPMRGGQGRDEVCGSFAHARAYNKHNSYYSNNYTSSNNKNNNRRNKKGRNIVHIRNNNHNNYNNKNSTSVSGNRHGDRRRSVSYHHVERPREYPVVLSYSDTDVKALLSQRASIAVAVEAMDWRPIPMTPSTNSFYAMVYLPAGNHNFRFIVNSVEKVDNTQPLAPRPIEGEGMWSASGNCVPSGASTVAAGRAVASASQSRQIYDTTSPARRPAGERRANTTTTTTTNAVASYADASVPTGTATTVAARNNAATCASSDAAPPPQPSRDRRPANTLYLNDAILTTGDANAKDDEDSWGQTNVVFSETRKYPPAMPVHLRYTPLNTPPTLSRGGRNGSRVPVCISAARARMFATRDQEEDATVGAAAAGADCMGNKLGRERIVKTTACVAAETSLPGYDAVWSGADDSAWIDPAAMLTPSAEHLPLPLSVTINHVYFQRREDHVVAGVTTRYRDKFTTIKYYTHMPLHPISACL